MNKNTFTTDFEINASPKMLYPYLNTAGGLAQWFADDVSLDGDKNFLFSWDGEENKAKLTGQRSNIYVKYEFLDEDEEPSYIEFKLEVNELTQATFLVITDHSSNFDNEELFEMWEQMVGALKEIVGG
ncbi:START-like domain-containing protein [Mangrovivirga sp. M17]|uniref:START-like domain-containing protein n=1 Tax=Mangrovivirga halotolerans TaxID=2993936 RepID=A0ABT3RSK7_9BACT|nr:START-like domain-containing protein [Mangrovivirga halotolerans]MCX2744339.1 START-like domain-containing protein [Mangrovivirga halotolerans]